MKSVILRIPHEKTCKPSPLAVWMISLDGNGVAKDRLCNSTVMWFIEPDSVSHTCYEFEFDTIDGAEALTCIAVKDLKFEFIFAFLKWQY